MTIIHIHIRRSKRHDTESCLPVHCSQMQQFYEYGVYISKYCSTRYDAYLENEQENQPEACGEIVNSGVVMLKLMKNVPIKW